MPISGVSGSAWYITVQALFSFWDAGAGCNQHSGRTAERTQIMSKKNYKKHHDHSCTGYHSQRPGLFNGVTLHIEQLDIHMDERMDSCNHYCGGCGADTEDGIEVDMEKLVEKVAADTGVDKDTVMKVIMAEDVYLQELGVCEVISEEVDEQNSEETAEADAAEQEAEDE